MMVDYTIDMSAILTVVVSKNDISLDPHFSLSQNVSLFDILVLFLSSYTAFDKRRLRRIPVSV